MGKILIFYKYTALEYPKRIIKWQQQLCQDLMLRGRILIAQEGINGTVGGTDANIERYLIAMKKNPLFADVDFKEEMGDSTHFPRMQITLKKEIVHFGIQKTQLGTPGKHLSADDVHHLIQQKPDNLIILDARNNFESAIGHFTGAIKPDINHFRDLPSYLDKNLEMFKDKQVLMYCTAGVRCEKATAYLKAKNVAMEVYQIEGGIHRYVNAHPNGYFKGKNYVFDGRVAVTVTDDVLATCTLCPTSCDEYTNCLNAECNKHFICCPVCLSTYENCCSQSCKELVTHHRVVIRSKRQKNYIQADQQHI